MPDKISVMTAAMNEHPEILLLASNYIPVKNDKSPLQHSYMKYLSRNDGEIIPLRLKDVWLGNLRPGCTFCFRRELLSRFSVMDIDTRLHDSMLWKYAVISDGLYLINRQLVIYRRHESNVTAAFQHHIPPNITQRMKDIDSEIDMYRRFFDASDGLNIPPQNKRALFSKINFMERRKKILAKRNPLATAIFVMMNMKYYPTFRNAMSDIYATIKLRE